MRSKLLNLWQSNWTRESEMPRLKAPKAPMPTQTARDPRASYVNGYNEAVRRLGPVFDSAWTHLAPKDRIMLRRQFRDRIQGHALQPRPRRQRGRVLPVTMPCRCPKKYTEEHDGKWVCTLCGVSVEDNDGKRG